MYVTDKLGFCCHVKNARSGRVLWNRFIADDCGRDPSSRLSEFHEMGFVGV